jgi:hypothetical protein
MKLNTRLILVLSHHRAETDIRECEILHHHPIRDLIAFDVISGVVIFTIIVEASESSV